MPRRRSSPLPPLLSLPILIVILPIFALLFLFFAVPPFLSVTSHIFRPSHTVKKSWDSLNVVLVLFAILCGILARRNDDVSETNQPVDENDVVVVDSDHKIDQTHSQQWFDQHYSERKVYDPSPEAVTATGTRRLRRNSSSYPDLRQDSLWETGDDRFRFFDDFDIKHKFRSPAAVPENKNYGHLRRTRSDIEESQVKVIPVDTFVLRSMPPPKSPTPPPPPPPPPPAVSQKSRRTYQTVGRKERIKVESAPPPPPPPPPPRPAPPPPSQTGNQSEQKYVKLERKKSNAKKEIKMVLSSILRKKKQKTKNISDYEDGSFRSPREQPQYSTIPPPSPPPPPPPLPPPPSVFHSLFRKSSKSKKVHSVPPPAPPPPPQRSSKRKGRSQTPPPAPPPAPSTPPLQPQPSRRRNTGKPPLPTRANSNLYDEYTMNISGGNQSPLNRMPPPPPLPPFVMAEPRFAVRGDFVSIHSSNSSRCSSPDHLEAEAESTQKVNNMTTDGGDNGGGGSGSTTCPSPDVNAKADNFIARLRDEWRLERDNSIKEKRNTGLQ
ncbi:hypothetical protein LWI28_014170 [Acer negundo]|uniref:Uncharacterized protein n=1 Tax=Acer negundo TaxID=4023 RepID=A0AAD5NZ64_ACENE|nr:hypothetical protein LWI28_014170 [Acer negundo]